MPTHEEYAVVREARGQKYQFTTFHESLELAREEAERLAAKEQTKFLVLKVVGYAEPQVTPIVWVGSE